MPIAFGILLFFHKPTWIQSLVFLSTYVGMVGVMVAIVICVDGSSPELGGFVSSWLILWALGVAAYAPTAIVAVAAAHITKLSSPLRAAFLTVFLGVILAVMGISQMAEIEHRGVLLVEVGMLSVLFVVVAGITSTNVSGSHPSGKREVSGRTMVQRVSIHVVSFLLGAAIFAVPCYIYAIIFSADEETLPGIVTFLGILMSPIGGLIALLITLWVEEKKQGRQNSEEPE
jgi:uncharacterized membrane protein